MKSIQISNYNHTRIMDKKNSKEKSADAVISIMFNDIRDMIAEFDSFLVDGNIAIDDETTEILNRNRFVFHKNNELKYCWNCTEDEETQTIGDDGLCDECRDLYEKDGTTFIRCGKCLGLIEYGGKNKTKHGDGCCCGKVK